MVSTLQKFEIFLDKTYEKQMSYLEKHPLQKEHIAELAKRFLRENITKLDLKPKAIKILKECQRMNAQERLDYYYNLLEMFRSRKLYHHLNIKEFKKLINKQNENGNTFLHIALYDEKDKRPPNIDQIEFLLKCRVNFNIRNAEGATPLHYFMRGPVPLHILQIILKNHHPPLGAVDNDHKTPLQRAISENRPFKVIKLLMDAGSPLETKDKSGKTALHIAIEHADFQTAQYLLSLGADVNSVDYRDNTPIYAALRQQKEHPPSLELIELLLTFGASLNHKNNDGDSPLHCLMQGTVPSEILSHLLTHRPSATIVNLDRQTTLHMAICKKQPIDIIRQLIDFGYPVDARDNNGKTSLHVAIAHYSFGTANYLLDNRADVNIADNDGHRPLHFAANPAYNIELIKRLIAKGADLQARNLDNFSCATALDLANIELPIDLSDRDKEASIRLLLASSWSVSKMTENEGLRYKLEGAYVDTLKKIITILQKVDEKSECVHLKRLTSTFERGVKNGQKKSQDIVKLYHQGEPLVFSSGWKEHEIQTVFWDDYMLLVNRGFERKESAVMVYKIDRKMHPINVPTLYKIKMFALSEQEGPQFFYDELPRLLGYQPNKQDLVCNTIENKCKQKDQKADNCWFLNNKTGLSGLFMLDRLLRMSKQTFPSEQEKLEAFNKAGNDALRIYKFLYSPLINLSIFKEYVERKSDQTDRDHELVKLVAEKIKSNPKKYIPEISGENKEALYAFEQIESIDGEKKMLQVYSEKDLDEWVKNYKTTFQLDENFVPVVDQT